MVELHTQDSGSMYRARIAALEAEKAALEQALREIGKLRLRRTDENSTICLRCGMETFHEKSGDVLHERDCVQQFAAALLTPSKEAQ